MSDSDHLSHSILRRKQVQSRTGLSRSTIYERFAPGTCPRPISLRRRTVGARWLHERIAKSRQIREIDSAKPDPGSHLLLRSVPSWSYPQSSCLACSRLLAMKSLSCPCHPKLDDPRGKDAIGSVASTNLCFLPQKTLFTCRRFIAYGMLDLCQHSIVFHYYPRGTEND